MSRPSSGGGPGRRGRAGGGRPPASPKAATAREVALDVLTKVEQSGAYSNLQLNRSLQEAKLPRADAALATELVYGTISRKQTIDYWLERFVAKGFAKLEPWVLQLLRLSLYQLVWLDRVPPHAAVNEAVAIAKRRGHAGIAGMVNGVLRSAGRSRAELDVSLIRGGSPAETIALRHSYPQWLTERWIAQFGPETAEAICASGNEAPRSSLRVNPLRTTRDAALAKLREEGIEAEPSAMSPAGIVLVRGGNPANAEGYREGLWSVQDESSMLVAEALAPKPGMTVLDCCAAPGGKTTHLAELMEGKGKVWANDLHEHKRKLIAEAAGRLKLTNVEAISGDAAALGERFGPNSMDAVLLDAPCSGFGVIRRKPEIKWTKSESDIREIAAVQRRLLEAAAGLVKPGGALVYSTCTIEQEENEAQIDRFLTEHPEFSLDSEWPEELVRRLQASGAAGASFTGQVQLLPQHFGSDGFFIARLVKRP